MSHETSRTTATVLTPPARGAIATVAVRGPQAVASADRYFHGLGKLPLADAEVGRILVGHWRENDQQPGEELVVAKLAEELVEIHCHGGLQASRQVLNHLQSAGCELESWQQWNSATHDDAIVAEAHLALPEAATTQAALHLWDQCQGALSRELTAIIALLDEPNFEVATQRIDQLLRLAPLGQSLTRPWSIVLAGPPNVGKSSLLNKIVGYDRAIVLDMPGTTRDVLHATTALDGWPVQFSDTAGIRVSDDQLEQAGIAKAKAALISADLVIVLHDAAQLRPDELDKSLRELPSALHVVNKIDLAGDLELPQSREMLATSAVTGEGISELITAIVEHLVPEVPQPGAPLPFTTRQLDALRDAAQCIEQRHADSAKSALTQLFQATI